MKSCDHYLPIEMEPDLRHDHWTSLLSMPRKIWYGTNLVAVLVIAWLSSSQWHIQLKPGSEYYGGPGDGLYFMFFLFLPWLIFTFLNVALLIRDLLVRRKRIILLTQCSAILIWIVLAWLLFFLIRAPEGVKYMGS